MRKRTSATKSARVVDSFPNSDVVVDEGERLHRGHVLRSHPLPSSKPTSVYVDLGSLPSRGKNMVGASRVAYLPNDAPIVIELGNGKSLNVKRIDNDVVELRMDSGGEIVVRPVNSNVVRVTDASLLRMLRSVRLIMNSNAGEDDELPRVPRRKSYPLSSGRKRT